MGGGVKGGYGGWGEGGYGGVMGGGVKGGYGGGVILVGNYCFLLSWFTFLFLHFFFHGLHSRFSIVLFFSVVDQLVCFCLYLIFFSLFFCLFVCLWFGLCIVLLYYLTLNVDCAVR